jgi:long-chain acyl-CoA synthetase
LGEKITDALLTGLVRRKVQAGFGGRLKALVSGGAPLNYDVGLFFTALGIRILQGYGQTESAPCISCNSPNNNRIDAVGPPMDGVELRIADDGEILVRGELVMQGYWQNPTATAEAIQDGWLHTGDIGVLDADGHLRITDRKKDIIVNSGGDNLSPQRIEGFLTLQPEIAQAMVYGDRRPHVVALIVPDQEFLEVWAKKAGREDIDVASLVYDDEFRAEIGTAIDRINADLSVIEKIRRFVISADPFTIENGMLTPTLKIRRHMIRNKYGDALEALYGG